MKQEQCQPGSGCCRDAAIGLQTSDVDFQKQRKCTRYMRSFATTLTVDLKFKLFSKDVDLKV